MGLFRRKPKIPEIICYRCGNEFEHKKIKWTKRMLDKKWLATQLAEKSGEDVNKIMADMDWLSDNVPASPNETFGHYEYEHVSRCPNCGAELRLLWFGKDSLFRPKDKGLLARYPELRRNSVAAKNHGSKDILIIPRPFNCHECKNVIRREFQCWYTIYSVEGSSKVEIMATLCQNCGEENGYPFDYDLKTEIIE